MMRRSTVLTLALLSLLAGCGDSLRTETIVFLDAEEDIKLAAPTIEVLITGPDGESQQFVTPSANSPGFPLSYGVLPKGGDVSRRFEFVAYARAGGQELAQVRLRTGFVKDTTRGITLVLSSRCGDCMTNATCNAGECVPVDVGPEGLEEIDVSEDGPAPDGEQAPPPASASCDDGVNNGGETGVDCGGSCAPCAAPPSCTDGVMNGMERGIDCGGSCPTDCATCDDGLMNGTETGVDCGGSCTACASDPTCADGVRNGDEAGVDCGGSCPACVSEPTCDDGEMNGDEIGVDCGGSCPACGADPTCDDAVMNGDETGVDCGGSCPACAAMPSCSDGVMNGDEGAIDCEGSCPPCSTLCTDGRLNGRETDVDCGGVCLRCVGNSCGRDTDCETGRCTGGACAAVASCLDLGQLPVSGPYWGYRVRYPRGGERTTAIPFRVDRVQCGEGRITDYVVSYTVGSSLKRLESIVPGEPRGYFYGTASLDITGATGPSSNTPLIQYAVCAKTSAAADCTAAVNGGAVSDDCVCSETRPMRLGLNTHIEDEVDGWFFAAASSVREGDSMGPSLLANVNRSRVPTWSAILPLSTLPTSIMTRRVGVDWVSGLPATEWWYALPESGPAVQVQRKTRGDLSWTSGSPDVDEPDRDLRFSGEPTGGLVLNVGDIAASTNIDFEWGLYLKDDRYAFQGDPGSSGFSGSISEGQVVSAISGVDPDENGVADAIAVLEQGGGRVLLGLRPTEAGALETLPFPEVFFDGRTFGDHMTSGNFYQDGSSAIAFSIPGGASLLRDAFEAQSIGMGEIDSMTWLDRSDGAHDLLTVTGGELWVSEFEPAMGRFSTTRILDCDFAGRSVRQATNVGDIDGDGLGEVALDADGVIFVMSRAASGITCDQRSDNMLIDSAQPLRFAPALH